MGKDERCRVLSFFPFFFVYGGVASRSATVWIKLKGREFSASRSKMMTSGGGETGFFVIEGRVGS
jgi:hypothetical protein